MIDKPDHLEWQRQLEALIKEYAEAVDDPPFATSRTAAQKRETLGTTARHLGVDMGDVIRWARVKAKVLAA